jgi:transcriptional regulator with XRE-family HTH domain
MPPAGPSAQRSAIDVAFGSVLRSLRIERGLSQEGLGNASGNGRTFVGQLERGERGASLKTLFALSKVLEVDAAEIVRLVGERVTRGRRH